MKFGDKSLAPYCSTSFINRSRYLMIKAYYYTINNLELPNRFIALLAAPQNSVCSYLLRSLEARLHAPWVSQRDLHLVHEATSAFSIKAAEPFTLFNGKLCSSIQNQCWRQERVHSPHPLHQRLDHLSAPITNAWNVCNRTLSLPYQYERLL